MRNYTRKYFEYGIYEISYLFSPSKKKSDKLMFCLPQGRREAQFFTENYDLPEGWNVIVVDMPGVGHTKVMGPHSRFKNLIKVFEKLILNEKFQINNTVIYGKSYTSQLAVEIATKLDIKSAIIVAGPRLFSKTQARALIKVVNLILTIKMLTIFTYIIGVFIFVMKQFSPSKYPHYSLKDTDQWYLLREICIKRLEKVSKCSTKTHFIENGKDELVSKEALAEVFEAFTNHKVSHLPTQTHWGNIYPEELSLVNETLNTL